MQRPCSRITSLRSTKTGRGRFTSLRTLWNAEGVFGGVAWQCMCTGMQNCTDGGQSPPVISAPQVGEGPQKGISPPGVVHCRTAPLVNVQPPWWQWQGDSRVDVVTRRPTNDWPRVDAQTENAPGLGDQRRFCAARQACGGYSLASAATLPSSLVRRP